jgi:hypothetical protein
MNRYRSQIFGRFGALGKADRAGGDIKVVPQEPKRSAATPRVSIWAGQDTPLPLGFRRDA